MRTLSVFGTFPLLIYKTQRESFNDPCILPGTFEMHEAIKQRIWSSFSASQFLERQQVCTCWPVIRNWDTKDWSNNQVWEASWQPDQQQTGNNRKRLRKSFCGQCSKSFRFVVITWKFQKYYLAGFLAAFRLVWQFCIFCENESHLQLNSIITVWILL